MSVVNFLAALLLMYVLWTVTVKRGVKNLTCQRSFSCRSAYEGEEAELVEVVRNDGPFILPWLRIESYVAPGLRLGRQGSADDASYYCSCFTLMPFQQIRRRHRVQFLRRGVYDLGNATFAAGDLMGLTRFWKEQQLSSPVTVYPQILDTEELPYPMTQMLGQIVTRNRLQQDPFMIRGIRPYQPGDLIRDIHWQATARTQEVQVRLHDNTVCPRLLVVLNAQRNDGQWDNYVREEDVPALEQGIRLAASMCVRGLRAGLQVGFAANMPRERGGESTILMPDTCDEDGVLDAFAHLQLHCSEKILQLLEPLQNCRDMDILVLSRYHSESLQQAMDKLKLGGNRVTFCLTEGGDL